MTQKNYTHITIVLDRSGSMSSIRDATIDGVAEFVKSQKALPGHATFTLAQFDNDYELLWRMVPLPEVVFNKNFYQPRGSTALLDAIGKTIDIVGQDLNAREESRRPEKVLFVIVTDGYENASHEFTREKIDNRRSVSEMISHQRNHYQWEFLFLGANQDAIVEAATYGIPMTHSMSYAATHTGTHQVYSSASSLVSNARRGGSMAVTPEERTKNQIEIDKAKNTATSK